MAELRAGAGCYASEGYGSIVTRAKTRCNNESLALPRAHRRRCRAYCCLGARAGRRVLRLYGQAAQSDRQSEPAAQVEEPGYGFCVHAERRVSAHDRAGRERPSRYVHRPPLAQRRLEILPNGNVRLGLKRAFRDGTTHVVFEPLDFLSKLAALVPPPRMQRTRYHGLWSSHASGRGEVTPKLDQVEREHEGCTHKPKRYGWARLLARVFAIDVLCCPKCSPEYAPDAARGVHDQA